jgi:hypothetical protein
VRCRRLAGRAALPLLGVSCTLAGRRLTGAAPPPPGTGCVRRPDPGRLARLPPGRESDESDERKKKTEKKKKKKKNGE